MVRIAMEMLHQGMIDEKTALMRCEPNKLDELLHPVFDKEELGRARVLTRGLRLLRVLPADVSSSSPKMLLNGIPTAIAWYWYVLKLLRKTWLVCRLPKVS